MLRLKSLPRDERLLLLKFICSFVWADLEVDDAERLFVWDLVRQAGLHADEERLVQEWLRSPPADVDPAQVPAQHRRLFVEAAREAIEANGRVSEPERETLELLDQLLR